MSKLLKRVGYRRLLAVLLALCMAVSLLSTGVFADTWTVKEQAETDYIYRYTGDRYAPSYYDANAGGMDSVRVKVDSLTGSYHIYKYTLQEQGQSSFLAYCSDFMTQPVAVDDYSNREALYKRIPLESVATASDFFTDPDAPGRLRSIMLFSDLYYADFEDLLAAANQKAGDNDMTALPETLTQEQVVSATQIAIWAVVNDSFDVQWNTLATANKNVMAYYDFLMALAPTSADKLASVELISTEKAVNAGTGTYDAAFKFHSIYNNVTVADAVIELAAKLDSTALTQVSDGTKPYYELSSDENGIYTAIIHNIPLTKDVSVALTTTQQNVNSVYLYTTEQRSTSQTLVSVVNGPLELRSDYKIEAPTELKGIIVSKLWANADNGKYFAQQVVSGYTSNFEIRYAGDENNAGMADVLVDTFSISGIGAYNTGDVLVKNTLYKLSELSVSPGANVTKDAASVRYFKITDDGVVWTDVDGEVTDAYSSAQFTNKLTLESTASLKVTKTLSANVGKADDEFTFTIYWGAAGDDDRTPYAGMEYTIHDADGLVDTKTTSTESGKEGQFKLKAGQWAIFDNIPVGSTMSVKETITSSFYSSDISLDKTAEIGSEGKTLAFINQYLYGKLTVNKALTGIQWSALEDGTLTITVTGQDGYSRTKTLTANGSLVFENLPVGDYTVTESGYDVTGYDLTVTADDGTNDLTVSGKSVSGTMTAGGEQTVNITNSYEIQKGTIRITKATSGLINGTAVLKDTFKFTVTGPSGFTPREVYLPTADAVVGSVDDADKWYIDVTGLEPGNYTVTETTPATDGFANFDYTSTSVTGGTAAANGPSASGVSVTYMQTSTVAFTNTYTRQTGSVSFKKNVTVFDDGSSFTFTVKVDGTLYASKAYTLYENDEDTTGTPKTTSSTGTLTLKNGERVTISGLPSGASVTVAESANSYHTLTFSAATGWTSSSRTGTATVPANGGVTGTLVFNNERHSKNLTVSKTVAGDLTWDNIEKVTFTITGPTLWGEGITGLTKVSDTQYSFMVTDATPVVFAGVPAGSYSITEVVTAKTGVTISNYDLATTYSGTNSSSSASFTIGSSNKTVGVTNTYSVKSNDLEIIKKLVNGDANHVFNFKVVFGAAIENTAAVSVSNIVDNSLAWNEDKTELTFSIQGAKTVKITGLPHGTTMTVTELSTGDSGKYVVTGNGGTGEIPASGSVKIEITNTRIADQSLTISKAIVAAPNADDSSSKEFSFTVKVNGVLSKDAYVKYTGADDPTGTSGTLASGAFKLKNGERIVLTGLPRGATVLITETNTGYTTTYKVGDADAVAYTSSGAAVTLGETENGTETVLFTNTRKTGNLTVAKALTGDAKDGFADTEFTLTLKNSSKAAIAGAKYKLNGEGDELTTDSSGQFKLKGGQSAVFTGLPEGTYYVAESSVTPDSAIKWTASYSVNGGTATVSTEASASVGTTARTIAFTNDFTYKTGTLDVEKTLSLSDGATNSTAEFTFTLYKDGSALAGATYKINGTGTELTTDASGQFKLKGGQTASFTGLKFGVYHVVEEETSISGYTLTSTTYNGGASSSDNAKKTLSADISATPKIAVVNTYARDTGGLSVTKTVTGYSGSKSFTFTLKRGSAAVAGANYTIEGVDGTLSTTSAGAFTLSDGQTAVFSGLPTSDYTVEESGASITGYSVTTTNNSAEGATTSAALSVSKGNTAAVAFTNAYSRQTGSLTVTKEVVNATNVSGFGTDEWEYTFKLGTSERLSIEGLTAADGGYTFTLSNSESSKTFTGLPTGSYTITELSGGPTFDSSVISLDVKLTVGDSAVSSVSVTAGETTSAKVTNTYRPRGSDIGIRKSVGGLETSAALAELATREFELIFTQVNPETSEPTGVTYTHKVKATSADGDYTYVYLPNGTYTVSENTDSAQFNSHSFIGVAININGETASASTTITINDAAEQPVSIEIDVLNSYSVEGGIIIVSKSADGYADANDVFEFKLTGLTGTKNKSYMVIWSDAEGNQHSTYRNLDPASGVFTLMAGEAAVFSGVTTEVKYTVEETKTGDHFTLHAVTAASYLATQEAGKFAPDYDAVEDSEIDGDVDGNKASATMQKQTSSDISPVVRFDFVNNRKLLSIDVSKTVTGPAVSGESFLMSLTFKYNGAIVDPAKLIGYLSAADASGKEASLTAGGSAVQLSIADGETVTISGVPSGFTWTLTEDTSNGHYAATISGNGTKAVSVSNERKTGTVEVMKQIVASDEDAVIDNSREFEITLTFYPSASGGVWPRDILSGGWFTLKNGNGTVALSDDGTAVIATLLLKNGQLDVIESIPVGTVYGIEETLGVTDEYSPVYVGYDGVVNPNLQNIGKLDLSDDSIIVTNLLVPNNSLFISKLVRASEGSARFDEAFEFTLSLYQPGEGSAYLASLIKEQLERATTLMNELVIRSTALNEQLTAQNDEYELLYKDDYDAAYAEVMALSSLAADLEDVLDETLAIKDVYLDGYAGRIPYSEAGCTDCHATGRVTTICADCEGSSTVENPCDSCDTTGWVVGECVHLCQLCEGTGLIEAVACDACTDGRLTRDECAVCDEFGQIYCPSCRGTAFAIDVDALLAQLEAEIAEYENGPVYAQHGIHEAAVEVIEDEQEIIAARLKVLTYIETQLRTGNYVLFDDDIDDEDDVVAVDYSDTEDLPDYELKSEQITIIDADGETTLTPDDIEFTTVSDDNDGKVYTFKLKHGQSVLIAGLPIGVMYSLTESEPASGNDIFEGYVVADSDGETCTATGLITDDAPVALTFTNTFNDHTGSIAVNKVFSNGRGGVSQVTVTLFAEGNDTAIGSAVLSEGNDWKAEFTNLPLGQKYYVVENAISGFTTSYTGNNLELTADNYDKLNSITVTNSRIIYNVEVTATPTAPVESETPSETPTDTPTVTDTPSETPTDGDDDVDIPTPPQPTTIPEPPPPTTDGGTLQPNDDGSWTEFDDDGVPLGNWTQDPETGEWIFDEEIPLAEAPVTGDSRLSMMSFAAIAIVCLTGIVALLAPDIKRLFKKTR